MLKEAPDVPPTPPVPRTAMVVSVGGSPAPILHTLRAARPDVVWYFCSAGSRRSAEEIHQQLDWRPFAAFIEEPRFEELGACYAALRRALPALLRDWRVDPEHVIVDYTGGTKTMSAALVLAAVEQLHQFSYVGGTARDKDGVGVVVSGAESLRLQSNPWRELGIREGERVRLLWSGGAWDEAAVILEQLATLHPRKERCRALADVARATASRHRFDFKSATQVYSKQAMRVRHLFEAEENQQLIAFVESARALCEQCREQGGVVASPDLLLRELMDNALRCADLGRHDDASARLYRAMEMQGQIWLCNATDGAFLNGRLREGRSLPDALSDCAVCAANGGGAVDLPMESVFRALAWLGHARAQLVVADVDADSRTSRWRAATSRRNSSILAHGVQPVGTAGFDQLAAIATDFLGFNLSSQANPIPDFELTWLG